MSVNDFVSHDHLPPGDRPAGLVRVQVVFHAWRAADRPARSRRGQRPASGPGEPASAGPGSAVVAAERNARELARPVLVAALVIGLAAAVDATRTVLMLTLAGVAVLAVAAGVRSPVRRARAHGRRSAGRHRARGRSRRAVIMGPWSVHTGRP